MASIRDIHNPWRDALLPASFDGVSFHVETGGREGGRRIVVHQFPKRELPYSEDLGRRAIEFTIRGYCIQFPFDAGLQPDASGRMAPLYMKDYRVARDLLQQRLDTGGPGVLQLPTARTTMTVVCTRYRLTEEEQRGGFCVFDMSFVEFGLPLLTPASSTQQDLATAATDTASQAGATQNDQADPLPTDRPLPVDPLALPSPPLLQN